MTNAQGSHDAHSFPVAWKPSDNFSSRNGTEVEAIIIHYTAAQSAVGAISWLTNPKAKASAHYVIDTDGGITQLVALDLSAWHAGGSTSRWRGKTVNQLSVGIELVNPGPIFWVDPKLGDKGGLIDCNKKAYIGDYLLKVEGNRVGWATYPARQIEALKQVLAHVQAAFPRTKIQDADWKNGIQSRICGHQHVDPSRKTDPGPAFPWNKL
jgi:N-acetylmuramoyl-L-alanine amidase